MFCPKEEKVVPPDEIIRGYEISPDKYLLITDEELESVTPERSRTIEIIEFIDMKDVDPIYYDHPYYLVPLKGGEKAYQLLAEVMRRTNKAGLAKFVLGEREYLVAVYSSEGVLALITLHYSDEILPDGDISPKEEKSAEEDKSRIGRTIRKMIADFDPEKYADRRRNKIMDIIRKKAKEKVPVEAPHLEEEGGEGPADLMQPQGKHAQSERKAVSRKAVDIAGRKLSLSNLEKTFILPMASQGTDTGILPPDGRVHPAHLKDRALTLKRYPEGVHRDFFFEKRCPSTVRPGCKLRRSSGMVARR